MKRQAGAQPGTACRSIAVNNMPGEDLCYLSGHAALAAFRERRLSPVELMSALIARAEKAEPLINAFADQYFDEAMDMARAAEARYMKTDGRLRPLEGLACALKDEIHLKGKRTTGGSLIFKDHIDTDTDVMAQRLQDAGVIFHVRTTTPEFCLAGVTHSRIWGVTRNPHNLELTCGGSSGGTGASLAAGTSTLGTGTDIGGSIRIPAGCCGIVGLKASYGRIPEVPVFNLDFYSHSGPMTRTVADAALMFNVISGPSPRDIVSLRDKLQIPDSQQDIRGWKVAYSLDLGYFEIDADVRRNTLGAVEHFRELGCEVEEVHIPWTIRSEQAAESYLNTLWGQHIKRLLPQHKDLMTGYALKFAEQAGRTSNEDFLQSLEVAVEMYDSFGAIMDSHDVFICPTNATTKVTADHDPFDRDFTINGIKKNAENGWILTYPFNMLSRCPVMSVPSGRSSNGGPTGIQIVGRTYDELSVFRAAAAYESLGGFFEPEGFLQ